MAEFRVLADDFAPYGTGPVSDFNVIRTSREGVLRSSVDQVSEMIGLTDNEMAFILGMTPRNLHRIQPDKRLGTEASERLLLLKNILLHGLDTFEGKKPVLLNWLRSSIQELNNQSPLQLMDTITGIGLVDDVLGRLDYGLPA